MITILENIIDNKKKELALQKRMTPVKELEKSIWFGRDTISLSDYLRDNSRTGIIAEFKRKSPSKGVINSTSSVDDVTSGYFREGASGVSILTDTQFFGGYSSDLLRVRGKNAFPILRKDFIVDEYQVIESKSIGADVILLIAAALESQQILKLSVLARSLNMEILMEIHDYKELDKVNEHVNIIGVNNRNLKTFEVNTGISVEVADKIPSGFQKISESGISSAEIIKTMRHIGYDGFLMGEKFMSTPDPVNAFSEFVKELI
jgi:indole-3-glycerol phosphate synthase